MQKKKQVLFRHRSMEMGGVEKVILSLLENLDREKFDLTYIVSLHQGELRNKVPAHVDYIKINRGKEDFSNNPLINKIQIAARGLKIKFLEKFPAIIDQIYLKKKFDIEIASTYADYNSVIQSPNRNSKKIGWLHSDITVQGLKGILPEILRNLQSFDHVIYGSQQSYDILHQFFPDIKIKNESVILNPIPIEELKIKAKEFPVDYGKIPTFVSVARLHFRKGFHKLIEAHKLLLDEGFEHQIIVVGDGEERENLENQIKQLGVEESFKLLGTKMNPYPYVKNADFYIMPSETEGWPLIIAETLILQIPIIATNVGGIPEMITNGKNGYLIDYDAEKMKDGMKEFLINSQLVATIRENLKDSEKQFDNQKIFDEVTKIIES
ncbi:glycosyltransferase [Epilithonimonas sp. JDS]|uniref:glycosyltransferase n=1 Tax=Epilithonimonas sp. JDS TaxID=2902797 RepID=UPI001E345664|nr:glycosyltransferase [Epilithonimonas sp. JDS]MCD9854187.1 glycosyltransferase [Epilithonimonas sp. JDS]